jgi:proton-dependent oligopeptide transporter, POT family
MGQRASTGITTFNTFWVYLVPLFGSYIADAHWGRYKTICVASAVAIVGHIILVISAIPPVITKPKSALGTLIVGIIVMGLGTGSFKPNISPLVVEQLSNRRMVIKELPSGERVIVDPAVTQSRIYHYFYLFINIGGLVGPVGMTYCEKYVGFWLAYSLPTALLLICPLVLWFCRNRYVRHPPSGSVLGKAIRVFLLANKNRWSLNPVRTYRNLHDGTFWKAVKPSNMEPGRRPRWMTFDDQWVDEVARGFSACSVFCWYPLYWLTYNQLYNNLPSQAAVMKLNGLPNDVMSNLDPFAIMIMIPICDLLIYPALRRARIRFTPIKSRCLFWRNIYQTSDPLLNVEGVILTRSTEITAGFFTGSMAMIWTCVIQASIYKKSICGKEAAGVLPGKSSHLLQM